MVVDAIRYGNKLDLLVASPQESGKSYWADELAANLAKAGKNVLIAVPSGALAVQHQEQIMNNWGVESTLLQSHAATFKGKEDDCPDFEEIQYYYKMGVDSKVYKQRYCRNCPFFSECPYPTQYTRAVDPFYNIVIIQHAHFSCRETLVQLFNNKRFDLLIIDESFIDSLIETVVPTEFEIETIKELDADWSGRLVTWLKDGGLPKAPIFPTIGQREWLYNKFEENKQPWRFKLITEEYNRGSYLHYKSGLKVFNPVPNVPVRVLTDATPTVDELKIVMNNPDLKVIGAGEVIDYRKFNPQNQVIQIIDSTLSKSSLNKDEKYFDLLSFIAEKCSNEFKNDRVLITTFKDSGEFLWRSEALSFFHEKYPGLDAGEDASRNRIVFDGMKIGINTYKDFTVQFLLASVYMSGQQLAESTYRSKIIDNYWRFHNGDEPIQNMFPGSESSGVDFIHETVRKIEPTGIRAYPGIQILVPEAKHARMMYEKNVGKSQQSMRLRFASNPDQRKIVYILGNYFFPSLLVTKTVLLKDIFAQL